MRASGAFGHAVFEADEVLPAVAVHRHLDLGGQRIGHRHTDAVQTARELVCAAGFLVELAA